MDRYEILPYHYVMINDVERYEAFRDGLRMAIAQKPEAVVADIGAGSGLLSMTAAREGAHSVVGFEKVTPI